MCVSFYLILTSVRALGTTPQKISHNAVVYWQQTYGSAVPSVTLQRMFNNIKLAKMKPQKVYGQCRISLVVLVTMVTNLQLHCETCMVAHHSIWIGYVVLNVLLFLQTIQVYCALAGNFDVSCECRQVETRYDMIPVRRFHMCELNVATPDSNKTAL